MINDQQSNEPRSQLLNGQSPGRHIRTMQPKGHSGPGLRANKTHTVGGRRLLPKKEGKGQRHHQPGQVLILDVA